MANLATVPGKMPANRFAMALAGRPFTSLDFGPSMVELIRILGLTYAVKGQAVESQDAMDKTAQLLYSEIQTYFKTLTVEEVELAFKNGVRGQYGDYFGLNIITYHNWLKAFQTDSARIQAKKEVAALPNSEIDKEKAEEMWQKITKKRFEIFKKTGVFDEPFPAELYDILEARNIIKLTASQKKEFYKQAEIDVKEHLQARRVAVDKMKRQEIGSILERMKDNRPTSTDQTMIKTQAKLLAIKDFYSGIETLNL